VTESTRERVVSLKGDGYFNVVHDRSHPFTVRAGSTTVRDVGTAFSVQSNENGVVTIVVDSGIVEIGSSRDSAVKGTRLGAKDRATVTNTGVVLVERAGQSADDLAWVQGRLVFRDTPLVQVGAELYRWYGVRLRVADSSLANLHLTASFSGEPIDKVLNIIALSLGARVERQGNIAILHRATAAPALR
jgi:transmembrane sensor